MSLPYKYVVYNGDSRLELREIGYAGALTMEFMPSASNPYAVAGRRQEQGMAERLDQSALQAIRHIKSLLAT
ncbi:hypothetical protein [Paenibacillus piri]|uniref:Uncharacterized protein n=1 Tax=Paenibacillus piri TaxID=2547395 RepID=A0A4V2ZSP8_9BACL|nr:hypothetical protein [Paenibacillus piri]TDF94024.1 hypothetical protein E1757_24295 [Paenibacillus piri]